MVHSTTILSVRHAGRVAIGGDGQVTIGDTVVKHRARKIRRLYDGKVAVGFAGAAADAFALLERFEAKLKDFQGNVPRAATEMAKDWRTDRVLRRLESLLAVVDAQHSLLLSGSGDVIVPDDGRRGHGRGPGARGPQRARRPGRRRGRAADRRRPVRLHQPRDPRRGGHVTGLAPSAAGAPPSARHKT